MLMIWICYFINHHFELVDHKGSSTESLSSNCVEKKTDERQREMVCVCGRVYISVHAHMWAHTC